MVDSLMKKIYNLIMKESEKKNMDIKPYSSQISVFFSDGIMNPLKIKDELNKNFSGTFSKEDYSLNLEDAPNDMALVKYSSENGKYTYEFAKKRINFYLKFDENDEVNIFESYKSKVKSAVYDVLLKYTDISRVGIAMNYFVNKKDDKHIYWFNKFKLPFYNMNSTSQMSFTINNNFIHKGLKFNNILILTNGKISNTKTVPIISIDVNNISTAKLSKEMLEYIFEDIVSYKRECLESMFKNE